MEKEVALEKVANSNKINLQLPIWYGVWLK